MKSKEKENLDPLHLISGDKQWPKVHDEEGKEISILFEYKLLQLYGPLFGIYVVPQLNDIYSTYTPNRSLALRNHDSTGFLQGSQIQVCDAIYS